jgi:hypothetical protein
LAGVLLFRRDRNQRSGTWYDHEWNTRTMTVKSLIEQLSKLPQDLIVYSQQYHSVHPSYGDNGSDEETEILSVRQVPYSALYPSSRLAEPDLIVLQ